MLSVCVSITASNNPATYNIPFFSGYKPRMGPGNSPGHTHTDHGHCTEYVFQGIFHVCKIRLDDQLLDETCTKSMFETERFYK